MRSARGICGMAAVLLAIAALGGCASGHDASGDEASAPTPDGWPAEFVPVPPGHAMLVDSSCASVTATSGDCSATWMYDDPHEADAAAQRLGVELGGRDWTRQSDADAGAQVYVLDSVGGRSAGYAVDAEHGLLVARITWGRA